MQEAGRYYSTPRRSRRHPFCKQPPRFKCKLMKKTERFLEEVRPFLEGRSPVAKARTMVEKWGRVVIKQVVDRARARSKPQPNRTLIIYSSSWPFRVTKLSSFLSPRFATTFSSQFGGQLSLALSKTVITKRSLKTVLVIHSSYFISYFVDHWKHTRDFSSTSCKFRADIF